MQHLFNIWSTGWITNDRGRNNHIKARSSKKIALFKPKHYWVQVTTCSQYFNETTITAVAFCRVGTEFRNRAPNFAIGMKTNQRSRVSKCETAPQGKYPASAHSQNHKSKITVSHQSLGFASATLCPRGVQDFVTTSLCEQDVTHHTFTHSFTPRVGVVRPPSSMVTHKPST